MTDNPVFKVSCSLTKEDLARTMRLYFSENRNFVGYAIQDNQFVLFKYSSEKMTEFPCPLDIDSVVPVIVSWFENLDYGREPDIDGDVEEALLCSVDGWGHIDGFGYEACFKIEPYWFMYGK